MMLDYFSHWIVQVFSVVFLTLLAGGIQKFLMRRIHRRLLQTKSFWDNIFVDALQLPLHVLIWLLGIAFAAQIVEAETDAPIFGLIEAVRYIGIISLIAWFLFRFVKRAEENILAKSAKVDKTTADAISKILRGSILITATLVTLQTFGVSISGILAFGGIGGIAIGFAAKDLLANFFGSFMLYLDRPFSVGDWIRSPDRQIEGIVEHIGWRLTRIRTFDKRPLYVPNHVFTTISIENPSRMRNRRINETIGVRYDDFDRIESILEEVRELLSSHPGIDQTQPVMAHFNEFGSSSLDFFIYAFTKATLKAEFHKVKEDLLMKIHQIISAHGAELAFPTTTVNIPNQMPEKIGFSDKFTASVPSE
ncbi:MAG: mechanosensitive ion channel family protein [Chlamydiales bacterium]|nr:mechanosensitive ion channel family protein [Chlamydiales bacterium]